MIDPIYSIVEKLAILEGRIAPTDRVIAETTTKQKKPALFNNLKKDESAIPMVGGVEFAEDRMEEDILGKVKASLADYLKSAEEEIKQDKDLIAMKKQDLDLKKKELKDLDLQSKHEVDEAIPMTLEDHQKLEVGDRICVTGPNDHQGEFGNITEFSPSGKFVVVDLGYGKEISLHISDVEYHDDQEDVEDWEDDATVDEMTNDQVAKIRKDAEEFATRQMTKPRANKPQEKGFMAQVGDKIIGGVAGGIKGAAKGFMGVKEDPNQTPAQGEAPAGTSDPTYAESAPVKSMNFQLEEMGGSVLVEIHGNERDGFCIRRAGKELGTRFKSLEECEMALEMFAAHRKEQAKLAGTADYIEEK
jgi:hypothetical protein